MLPCKVATFDKRQKLFLSTNSYCDKIVQRSGMVDIWLSTDFVVGIGWCLGKLAGKHLARPTAQLWDATKPPSHIPHIWNQFFCEAAICHTLYLHSGGKFIWSLRGCDTKCLHVHSVIKPSVGHVSAFIAQPNPNVPLRKVALPKNFELNGFVCQIFIENTKYSNRRGYQVYNCVTVSCFQPGLRLLIWFVA